MMRTIPLKLEKGMNTGGNRTFWSLQVLVGFGIDYGALGVSSYQISKIILLSGLD